MNKPKKTLNTFEERNNALAEDLESGNNEQGYGRLRYGKTFCCLGRACEVFRKATGKGSWDGNIFKLEEARRAIFLPPQEVSDWFGWSIKGAITNPDITVNGRTSDAGDFNDKETSFKEIAKGFRALAKSFK